jgi:SRSO17 transposase
LDVEPYTPAKRLKKGRSDPAFRTKPQIAVELVERAREASIPFRAVVADCLYGENPDFQRTLQACSQTLRSMAVVTMRGIRRR